MDKKNISNQKANNAQKQQQPHKQGNAKNQQHNKKDQF